MLTRLDGKLSHVSELPDIPTLENGYTPEALKAVFDRAGEQIREYVNTVLLPELEEKGAESVGVTPLETVEGACVQKILEGLALQVQEVANGAVPDGTVTPDKFVPSVASFITEGSPRGRLFAESGEHVFVPTRSGNYKISVLGGGGGGDVYSMHSIPCGGNSGAFAMGWFRLEAGESYRVLVGHGGKNVTTDGSGKCISAASNGGASGFYDGDTELLYADGGYARRGGIAEARGGTVRCRGCSPRANGIDSGILTYTSGAPSHLGGETPYGRAAELGSGGAGARYDYYSGVYTDPGGVGGTGAVLIEWME